jgi:8-oxo-dGTP diphosphatase
LSNVVVRPKPDVGTCPRGKVDYLERVEDAICRETLEETGLTIRLVRFLHLTQMIGQDGQHWLSPVWLAEVEGAEADNLEPDKAEHVAWFPLEAPPAPLGQAVREAIAELAERR